MTHAKRFLALLVLVAVPTVGAPDLASATCNRTDINDPLNEEVCKCSPEFPEVMVRSSSSPMTCTGTPLSGTTCRQYGNPVDKVCCTELNDALNWLFTSTVPEEPPSATARACVDIGPGTYVGLYCGQRGHVTFFGSGRFTTRIWESILQDCVALGFRDLTVDGGVDQAVVSVGSGSSDWFNVDLVARQVWVDYLCGTPTYHRFRNSRWDGELVPYSFGSAHIECGVMNFLGGEMKFVGSGTPSASQNHYALTVTGSGGCGFLSVTDSAVRIGRGAWGSGVSFNAGKGVTAVRVQPATSAVSPGPIFQMFSGIINTGLRGGSSPVTAGDVTTIEVTGSPAVMQTYGTAFVLEPGVSGGGATRLAVDPAAVTTSSFRWESSTGPPPIIGETGIGFSSKSGADSYVETDCPTEGDDCDGSPGAEAHEMTYDPSCVASAAASPWCDQVLDRCRNDSDRACGS